MEKITKAASIGGGVIGGGWIARFILNGIDVTVYDPHPEAERIVYEVLANAECAYEKLLTVPLGQQGKLTFASTLKEAVADADYIQESIPERLNLKHKVFAEIEAFAKPNALIGSSTSNFKPSELQEGMKTPERLFVAHPFNPVYLLPLVEIVPSPANREDAIEKAVTFLGEMGMKPLRVRKEIDAHIGDRLLEAVWREGLWLIHDDIATTEEIDDVIRFGLGLRFAQMGQYETYRIAGGEGGMLHFIEQFGPALKWPLTKLMDVPDYTDELVGKIASQSDDQSGAYSIRELERIRDDNLVGILQALKVNNWGAGTTLKEMEQRFRERAEAAISDSKLNFSKPLALHEVQVRGDWIDCNGHLSEHRYLQVFGDATDAFLQLIGLNKEYRDRNLSMFTAESHLRHLREVAGGSKLRVETQLLAQDENSVHIAHEMFCGTEELPAATSEHMLIHVSANDGQVCAFKSPVKERLAEIWTAQSTIGVPDMQMDPFDPSLRSLKRAES